MTTRHRRPRLTAGWLLGIGVFLLIIACTACGTPTEAAPPATDSFPATLEITADLPALAVTPAVRIDPPASVEQAAPWDPVAYVNGLPYAWTIWAPARDSWRVVMMVEFGWTALEVAAWEPFAEDVIMKESGGCWNFIGGDLGYGGGTNGCELTRWGSGSDSGFGQLISLWYRPGGPLCQAYAWLCSQQAIVSSPWTSMVAFGSRSTPSSPNRGATRPHAPVPRLHSRPRLTSSTPEQP